jgi:hypothetical protein
VTGFSFGDARRWLPARRVRWCYPLKLAAANILHSMPRFSSNPFAGGVGRSEHVSLASDLAETRAKPDISRALRQFQFRPAGSGSTSRILVLPDYYVAVETRHSGGMHLHTVDLRFVDPKPIVVRNVPWRWLCVAMGLTALTALAVTLAAKWPNALQAVGGWWVPVGLGAANAVLYVVCYRLATESLLFLSRHGRVRAIAIAGRLGTARHAKACAADVVVRIKLARQHFNQTRPEYLRDEMREHARLYEQAAFSEDHYNDAKRRILKAHEQR